MKFFLISAKALSQLHFPLHSPLQGWSNLTLIRGETFTKNKISLDWVNREYSVIKKIMDDEISFSFWCLEIWARSNLPLELEVIPNGLVCLFRLFFFSRKVSIVWYFLCFGILHLWQAQDKKKATHRQFAQQEKKRIATMGGSALLYRTVGSSQTFHKQKKNVLAVKDNNTRWVDQTYTVLS